MVEHAACYVHTFRYLTTVTGFPFKGEIKTVSEDCISKLILEIC